MQKKFKMLVDPFQWLKGYRLERLYRWQKEHSSKIDTPPNTVLEWHQFQYATDKSVIEFH